MKVSGDVPSPRAALAHVLLNKKIIIFGGYSENTENEHFFYNDVYSFDLETYEWKKEEDSEA